MFWVPDPQKSSKNLSISAPLVSMCITANIFLVITNKPQTKCCFLEIYFLLQKTIYLRQLLCFWFSLIYNSVSESPWTSKTLKVLKSISSNYMAPIVPTFVFLYLKFNASKNLWLPFLVNHFKLFIGMSRCSQCH